MVIRRALFAWAVWLALVPLAYGALAPRRAEAVIPLVIIGGIAYTLDTPIVLAVLAAGVAVLGEVYCASDQACADLVQSFVDEAPGWLIEGIQEAVGNGLGLFNISGMAGYDATELTDAFEAAALPPSFTQRTKPATLVSGVVTTVNAPVNIVTIPSQAYADTSADRWVGPTVTVPGTAVDVATSQNFNVTNWEVAFPTGGLAPSWVNGTRACYTTSGSQFVSPSWQFNCLGAYRNTAGAVTWPTGVSSSGLQAINPGQRAVIIIAGGGGGGFTGAFEVADAWYRWAPVSGSQRSAWTRVPALAGTFTVGGGGDRYTGAVGTAPAGGVAVPAVLGQLVGTVLTPDTQVTNVNGGTVPLEGGADVVGVVNTGFLGMTALLASMAASVAGLGAFITTATAFFDDFAGTLGTALSSAMGGVITDLMDGLTGAFTPTVPFATTMAGTVATWQAVPPYTWVTEVSAVVTGFAGLFTVSGTPMCLEWTWASYPVELCTADAATAIAPIPSISRGLSDLFIVGFLVWYVIGWYRRFFGGE